MSRFGNENLTLKWERENQWMEMKLWFEKTTDGTGWIVYVICKVCTMFMDEI